MVWNRLRLFNRRPDKFSGSPDPRTRRAEVTCKGLRPVRPPKGKPNGQRGSVTVTGFVESPGADERGSLINGNSRPQ
jgi:hypothetical protein